MVFSKLMPRDERYFELFEAMSQKVREAATLLRELLEHATELEQFARRMKELEHDADQMTRGMADMLHRAFVTPFDREDIHALVSSLDDVIDFVDSATQRMVLFGCGEPTQTAKAMAEVLEKQCTKMVEAVQALPRFQKRSKEIVQLCLEIKRLENEGDTLLRQGIAALFKTPGIDPLFVIKWKEVYEKVEKAIDCAEDVANVLEGIVIKHA
jgi:predicted phosphate transport protein (TIGR00153 family)